MSATALVTSPSNDSMTLAAFTDTPQMRARLASLQKSLPPGQYIQVSRTEQFYDADGRVTSSVTDSIRIGALEETSGCCCRTMKAACTALKWAAILGATAVVGFVAYQYHQNNFAQY
jgi:hypothetical protein